MLVYLVQPVSDIRITLLFRAIVAENDAIGAFVIRLSDRSKSLLASSVPNLELNVFTVYWDVLDLKVNTYTRYT